MPWFTGFGDELSPRRARPICARAQLSLEPVDKALLTAPVPDAAHCHPVDPGCASTSIRGHAPPGLAQHARVGDPTPHVPPRVVGVRLTPLSHAAKSRPDRNNSGVGVFIIKSEAPIGPTPGICARRQLHSSARCHAMSRDSTFSISACICANS